MEEIEIQLNKYPEKGEVELPPLFVKNIILRTEGVFHYEDFYNYEGRLDTSIAFKELYKLIEETDFNNGKIYFSTTKDDERFIRDNCLICLIVKDDVQICLYVSSSFEKKIKIGFIRSTIEDNLLDRIRNNYVGCADIKDIFGDFDNEMLTSLMIKNNQLLCNIVFNYFYELQGQLALPN